MWRYTLKWPSWILGILWNYCYMLWWTRPSFSSPSNCNFNFGLIIFSSLLNIYFLVSSECLVLSISVVRLVIPGPTLSSCSLEQSLLGWQGTNGSCGLGRAWAKPCVHFSNSEEAGASYTAAWSDFMSWWLSFPHPLHIPGSFLPRLSLEKKIILRNCLQSFRKWSSTAKASGILSCHEFSNFLSNYNRIVSIRPNVRALPPALSRQNRPTKVLQPSWRCWPCCICNSLQK